MKATCGHQTWAPIELIDGYTVTLNGYSNNVLVSPLNCWFASASCTQAWEQAIS